MNKTPHLYKNIAVRHEEDGSRFALEILVTQDDDGNSSFAFVPDSERILPLTPDEAKSWVASLPDGLEAGIRASLIDTLTAAEDPYKHELAEYWRRSRDAALDP
jgi:hypothetical protein